MRAQTVAIVGATGAVGQELLSVLDERDYPIHSLKLLASARSAGKAMRFLGADLRVEELCEESFRGVDLAFFSAGGHTSRRFAPIAVQSGTLVIDNSSAFRMNEDVPLVVPEVNADCLRAHSGIIANPNCSTIILVLALEPLKQAVGIDSVVVSTYQAASGAGQRAMEELYASTKALLAGEPAPGPQSLSQTLAFNLFPHIDAFMADGYTKEEDKMLYEVRKILGMPELRVDATCVRVPVARSHSESVAVSLRKPLSVTAAHDLFENSPGLQLLDDPSQALYPMPRDFSGKDEVGVGRVRKGRAFAQGLSFWLVGDQLKKGAALNAVQIAEAVQAIGS
jgi:aspartate-semialdehyde dehydrogenase